MLLNELLARLSAFESREAIIWHDKSYTYHWLLDAVRTWQTRLRDHKIKQGAVLEIDGDFSPNTIALLLASIEHLCITVPIARQSEQRAEVFRQIAQVEYAISIDDQENVTYHNHERIVDSPLLLQLQTKRHPGLILFSSGTTGRGKAAVHDWTLLLEKYKKPRQARRTIVFLLFDHIGGINTLLHTLFNGGCVVVLKERTPQSVCEAIANHKVQVLPTSPTFLNIMLISHAYEKYDLSSLELITYGTEVMPASLLDKINQLFPNVRLLQTYGLSEVGILHSKSKSSNSFFMKIEDEHYKTRVRDGQLEIKTDSAMLGFLNAASPFTEDGWLKTGDMVEVDGEYIHILGRVSDIINVGGLKVYPVQVENVIEQMDNVEDVIVTSEASPITGRIVKATVKLAKDEPFQEFRKRMIKFCRDKLEPFAIPQKIVLVDVMDYGVRFKKSHKAE